MSDMRQVLWAIYDYMCGDMTSIMNSTVDQLLIIYNLLQNNLIPEIVNGFASLEGVVEDGFADTALEIQSQTASLINTLNSLFAHLELVIGAESDDIQAAIAVQTAEIKAYLEAAFSGAVSPELNEDVIATDDVIQDTDTIEKDLAVQMDSAFGSIDFESASVPAGVLSALVWVVGLFEQCFAQLGEWQMLIILPMFVGLVLLIIGRGVSIAGRRPRRDYKPSHSNDVEGG